MARDRLVTMHKIARCEGALTELLDCADVELARPLRLALRAVVLNRQWLEVRREEGGQSEEETAEAEADGPAALAVVVES